MKPRHKARTVALQTLYEADLTRHNPADILAARLAEQEDLPKEAADFARQLVESVLARRAALDPIIGQVAPEWPVDQLPVIDRNIMRLAMCEIQSRETPVKVAIDEAVELAKSFGSDSSPRFVNGALGAFVTRYSR